MQSQDRRPGCHVNILTLGPGDSSEYPLHQSLEGSRGVHQPERHHSKFMKPTLHEEGSLFSVRVVHLHLPVSASQVEATEEPRTAEGVETVLNVLERIAATLVT